MLSKIVQKIAHNISQNIDLKIVQIIVQKIVQKMFQRKLSRRLSKTLSWENYPENYPENWPENCSNNCQGDFQKIDQKLPTYIHFTDFKMYLANDKTNFFPSCFCQSLKSEMFLLCAFSVSYWKCVLRFNFLSKKEIKHQSFLNPSCKVAWVIGIFCSVNENVEIEKWFSNLHHREKKIEAETAESKEQRGENSNIFYLGRTVRADTLPFKMFGMGQKVLSCLAWSKFWPILANK